MAQPTRPIDYGLKTFSIADSKLGLISFYVDTTGISRKAPLFIDINGSGGLPLCIYVKGKKFEATANTFTTEIMANTKSKYHYVILDKPGTHFCDTVITNQSVKEYDVHEVLKDYKFSDEYTKRLSLQWRVEATKKVVSYLIKHKYWDKTKIVAYGYSEGGQVVPTLAAEDKRITHIAAVVGSGLNQFYDGIIGWRIKSAKGEITQQQAQDSIEASLKNIANVYKNPTATDKEIGGHSYQRWASFCSVAPFEQLRKLTIPIYMVAATADNSSPIYGLDYVPLEFLRLGKTNLTYDACVGCNHYLSGIDDGKQVSHDYLRKILDWVDRN
ncbi:alpha/beta hydrolase family protein [Flavitalea sp.]|nr:hypothetical protein [Flavitalea sp.]